MTDAVIGTIFPSRRNTLNYPLPSSRVADRLIQNTRIEARHTEIVSVAPLAHEHARAVTDADAISIDATEGPIGTAEALSSLRHEISAAKADVRGLARTSQLRGRFGSVLIALMVRDGQSEDELRARLEPQYKANLTESLGALTTLGLVGRETVDDNEIRYSLA